GFRNHGPNLPARALPDLPPAGVLALPACLPRRRARPAGVPAGALAQPPKLPARVKGWRLKSLCGVTRNDEVEPTVQVMASDTPSRGAALRRPRGLRNRVRRLGRDYLYILPGLPLSAVSLSVLVVLTLVSVGTVVIW